MSSQTPQISLFDKSYNASNSNAYKLYVEISLNGLKHIILNTESNTFIGIEEYNFIDIYNDYSLVTLLTGILKNNTIYSQEYKTIQVSYVNNRSTIIPNAIYKADKLKSFHQFNFTKQEEDQFYSDQLINLSARNIFSIPDFITEIFSDLKSVSFKHFSSALIESSLINAKLRKTPSLIHLHILPSSFQVLVIKNQKLTFYNSFNYQSSEDFIYYLLFVLDQLKIDNEDASIVLTGEVEKNSTIYAILLKYIKTLSFGDRPENLKFSYIFEETPSHFHHSLFNQFLCE